MLEAPPSNTTIGYFEADPMNNNQDEYPSENIAVLYHDDPQAVGDSTIGYV